PIERVLEAARQIDAKEVILPDVPFNYKETL
ncbi:hypothetical protein LCGC14_2151420, partial [marine sediment metagenome]